MSRRFRIALSRTVDEHGAVPLSTLVRSLGAFQRATCQIAEMLSATSSGRSRGGFSSAILQACSFQVMSLSSGSAIAELELPTREQPQFPELDLGARATNTFLELSHLLNEGESWERVVALLPAEKYRRQVLSTYQDICPTEDEDISVAFEDLSSGRPGLRLSARERALARVYAVKTAVDDIVEERTFLGRLVTVSKKDGFSFGLAQGRRELEFPVGLDQQELLFDLLRRDAWIRVDAVARVIKHEDHDDEVVALLDVDEVIEVDMSPLNITSFTLDGRSVSLSAPLMVTPRAEGGLVVYEYPSLRIVASGATPEAAEAEFLEELAWLWESYASASDHELSADARDLKSRLHQLVEGGV